MLEGICNRNTADRRRNDLRQDQIFKANCSLGLLPQGKQAAQSPCLASLQAMSEGWPYQTVGSAAAVLAEPCYLWPFASSACYPPLVQHSWFPLGSTTAPCMTLLHVWKRSGVSAGLALHHTNVPVLQLGGSRQRQAAADSSFLQQVNQVSASKDLPMVNPNFSAGAGTFPEAARTNCSPNCLFH